MFWWKISTIPDCDWSRTARPQQHCDSQLRILLPAVASAVYASTLQPSATQPGATHDRLLPAAMLRGRPPSHKVRASSVVGWLTFILGIVPLCSYGRVQGVQGVAFASSLPSTEGTACLAAAISQIRHGRPAVLLSCWTLVAEPEDLLAALCSCVG